MAELERSNDAPRQPLLRPPNVAALEQTVRPKLLIVDDQPISVQALYHIFANDHEVFVATSGRQALTFCMQCPPDLILLDVVMPGMDGYEVCRLLKADEKTREIPVIFVTAQDDPSAETLGLELGAVDFISKPVNPAPVRARVRTHLQLKFQADLLEQVNQTLEARVAERTAELKQAMQHLVQTEKLASLGSMVAGITHELATPLSNVRMAAATLADSVKKLSVEISSGSLTRVSMDRFITLCQETSALIDRASKRSEALILSFKQVAVDQTSERRCRFDLLEITEHTVQMLAPTLKTTPFTVTLEIAPGILIDSYPGPIEQIITNFLTNSLAHAFPDRDSGCMRIFARDLGEQVEIVYSDDGIGIPLAIRPFIFDPFFTTKAGQGGSGLGMYTIYKLVTGLLGGSIHIDAHNGGGASFTIRLPHQ